MLNFALLHVRLVFLSSHLGRSPYIRFHLIYIVLCMDKNYPGGYSGQIVMPLSNERTISSYEIAEITDRNHGDVLRSIRNMEPAWRDVHGRGFALMLKIRKLPNGGSKNEPYYELTKIECLYISTKFNDEARAKLVLRLQELEILS